MESKVKKILGILVLLAVGSILWREGKRKESYDKNIK
jgi:hypothetical protein